MAALDIPIESQIVVFSKTSMQKDLINPDNPRTIFFNESTSVAWMSGGLIEVMSYDINEGVGFFTMPQKEVFKPRFTRESSRCLRCHITSSASLAPGFLASSIPTDLNGSTLPWLGNFITDQSSPLKERWAGWYVTGESNMEHLGNMIIADENIKNLSQQVDSPSISILDNQFDTGKYLSPYSDVVALMVFDHQMTMINLLIELSAQAARLENKLQVDNNLLLNEIVNEVVDYMLFIDEAPLNGIHGTSGFTETFSTLGPADGQHRSLRQFSLEQQLMRFKCSYMIYSEAFTALPDNVRTAVYKRLWEILSGNDKAEKYAGLSLIERTTIIEILQDTKDDLPVEFENSVYN